MKNNLFSKYYLFSCIGVLLASYYPLSMGVSVITDMLANGTVFKENYPKYIIPYTPICLAIFVGVLIMPLCIKLFKQFALIGGSVLATGTFFALEILFEKRVVVTTDEVVIKLEDWQMFMCAVPPEGWGETVNNAVTTYRTETPIDILMGNYNPHLSFIFTSFPLF